MLSDDLRIAHNIIDAGVPVYDGLPCEIWQGGVSAQGYGRSDCKEDIEAGHGSYQAHRQAAWRHLGAPPPGKNYVCHTCDIPLCVRPSHLFWGSQGDNMRDARSKLRHQHGETHYAAKLSNAEVDQIRDLAASNLFYQREIGVIYGVRANTISRIVNYVRRPL